MRLRLLAVIVTVAGTLPAQDTLLINGSPGASSAPLGSTLVVQLDGPAGTVHVWGFDTDPGPTTLTGGVVAPIGFSMNFVDIGGGAPFPSSGRRVLTTTVTSDPALVGTTWYSVAAFVDPTVPLGATLTNAASFTVTTPGTPRLARNPQSPDLVLVGSADQTLRGVGALNTAGLMSNAMGTAPGTFNPIPVSAGESVVGAATLEPDRLTDSAVLGRVLDMEIGAWLRSATALNTGENVLPNPGRSSTLRPGVPDTQNGTTPAGMMELILPAFVPPPFPPLQPWGQYVYVADGDAGTVRVLDSFTWTPIATLQGPTSASALGIAPDLSRLYASDAVTGTLHVFDANPLSPNFHNQLTTIQVGLNPIAVTVQPSSEDVFVANFGESTVSVIDTGTLTEITRFNTGLGPTDIAVTPRMLGVGLTQAYTAFVTNFWDDSVTIWESDAPGLGFFGVVTTITGFSGPRRAVWNWQSYIWTPGIGAKPGAFIVNSTGTTVDELTLYNFTLGICPGFPPCFPGTRFYSIQRSFDSAGTPAAGASPTDVAIDPLSGLYSIALTGAVDNKLICDPAFGNGNGPTVLLVAYPSVGVVVLFDYTSTNVRGTIVVPGCELLHAFYDQ